MKFNEDLKAIADVMNKRGIMAKEITEGLTVRTTAGGSAGMFDDTGGYVRAEDLTSEQIRAVREKFNIGSATKNEFDDNPLIPWDGPPPKKKEPSENEFDKNLLIPD